MTKKPLTEPKPAPSGKPLTEPKPAPSGLPLTNRVLLHPVVHLLSQHQRILGSHCMGNLGLTRWLAF